MELVITCKHYIMQYCLCLRENELAHIVYSESYFERPVACTILLALMRLNNSFVAMLSARLKDTAKTMVLKASTRLEHSVERDEHQ